MRARNAPKRRPPKAVRVKRVRKFPGVSPVKVTNMLPAEFLERFGVAAVWKRTK